MNKTLIFNHKLEDFSKIFLATFLVFAVMCATDVLTSTVFVLLTVYFLDGGHVYSTFLEVLGDPEEVRKKYVWVVLLGSFFLNLIVHFFLTPYFFYYIFYFTVYHNMRQGLGVTFLYRIGEKRRASFVKWGYYFLTVVPFVLFHMKPSIKEGKLGEAILRPINLSQFMDSQLLEIFFKYGVIVYILGALLIAGFLLKEKNGKGLLSMLFFMAVYAYAFLISNNEMKSYALLIFSHAIPYYFLMEKRLVKTHKLNFMQRYAWLFLLTIFAIGGALDYYQEDIISLFEPFDSLGMALLTTPLISHFIYDAVLWKRDNERFLEFCAILKKTRLE
ncbi:MAG: hypothetical protein K2Q18_07165 [Bdellovibrionales bacterium]|nr:hypothetical protein [Bdellovibrionales bacterium]